MPSNTTLEPVDVAELTDLLNLLPRLESLPAKLPKKGITVVMHRLKLTPAPYNPRSIDPYAQQGLLSSIKQTGGLVDDPIWNRRTSNLVGGHQRLEQEDKRRGTQDYWLSVKVVDWPLKIEKQVNVALNNPNIQGQYDLDLLTELAKGPDFDILAAGFTSMVEFEDLFLNAGADLPAEIFGNEDNDGNREAEAAADDVAETLDEADAARAAEKEREKVDAIKDRRREYQRQSAFNGQSGFHFTVIFPTNEIKQAVLRFLQLNERAERVDGVLISRFLGWDIPEINELEKRLAGEQEAEVKAESESQTETKTQTESESSEYDAI